MSEKLWSEALAFLGTTSPDAATKLAAVALSGCGTPPWRGRSQ